MKSEKRQAKKSFFILLLIILNSFICGLDATGYSDGSGTAEDPYQIADANDLLELAAEPNDYDKCFILTADIDLQGQTFTAAVIALDRIDSGGFEGTAFTGTLDGGGHKITHFTINGGSNDYLGLFGQIGAGGEVKNLGLENFAVSGTSGSLLVGGLVGWNYDSSISNCYSTGNVSGSSRVGGLVGSNWYGSISNCSSTGSVSGYYDFVGGLVGQNESSGPMSGIINCCYSTGAVSSGSNSQYVGGLVGWNGGSVNQCYSTGSVSGYYEVGGLVGQNDGDIAQSYSTGAVGGTSFVGGLVGINYWNVISSFWDVNTSGWTTSAGGEGKTTEQIQDINTFLDAGWDFVNETANGTCNYWQMPSGGGYPVLSIFNGYIPPEPAGSGTEEDPYVITDANDLGTIWYRPWAHYVLANDISLAGIEWSMAVVPVFSGVLDGNGFCTRYLYINGGNCLGLFGLLNLGGQLKNLGLENCTVIGSSDSSGYVGSLVGYVFSGNISNCYSTGLTSGSWGVGGLVGINENGSIDYCSSMSVVNGSDSIGGLLGSNYDGSISNCDSTGTVSSDYGSVGGLVGSNSGGNITDCYSMGTVSGFSDSQYVGGLVGSNDSSSISNCYATGSVSGSSSIGGLVGSNRYGNISDCYATGLVSGLANSQYVGGLAGTNEDDGYLISCYSTGSVSGFLDIGGLTGINYSTINNCYSTGDASGDNYVGGLVGENYDYGSISNCYSTGQVSGESDVGGLVGFDPNVSDPNSAISCFWDVNTSGWMTSAGGEGKTTAEMKTLSTFTSTGWDFANETANGDNNIWRMCVDGVDYPRLNWESIGGDFACPDGVNIEDLEYSVQQWLLANCTLSNNYCGGADIDGSGTVDFSDFAVFANNWLKGL